MHVVTTMAAGCSSPAKPHYRVGSLPFPGPFTLFDAADPDALGHHSYELPNPFDEIPDEQGRGIVYTCRAGFLDLAHLRSALDWTRYFTEHLERAIVSERRSIELDARDWTTFRFTFDYPQEWDRLDYLERGRLARALALRIGQRASYLYAMWHEILTWNGYKTTVVVPEDGSAFTWDDGMSHLVGVHVAAIALQQPTRPFDEAATEALRLELDHLGVVSVEQMYEAIERVKGRWWADGVAQRRHLDTGLDDGVVVPWLVEDVTFCGDAQPQRFRLPDLLDVLGRDWDGFVRIEVISYALEMDRIRGLVPHQPEWLMPDRDFPLIVEHVRAEMIQALGHDVDLP
jgi:hypothetical protein